MKEALAAAGFLGETLEEEPLAPYTTWRIGGPAEVLATPKDRSDVLVAVGWARERGVPWRILGNGSNVLVDDAGVRGIVLRLRRALDEASVAGTTICAGAGASFPALANLAARHGLSGLEFAAGIPGTLGGALVMNAGWHEHETKGIVTSVDVLEDGRVATFDRDACGFGYRVSAFRGRPVVVLGAELSLSRDDPKAVRERLDGFAAHRKATQPTELPSCGSTYLKPPGDFAGRLIEAVGLKGKRVGGIEVSEKHANFFVNVGGGTSRDVLALTELVEARVLAKLGVALTREFELWGG
ncbi:MAG TPA: UDP-N-acetylmuramate dehydrogenase [Candidatus Bathyarchaeia archaeon]|nr:UDP-N-acetylmuramate dehydrogenase [Candidatus Bathyarchaeia archaeon]